ncbi:MULTISPECIES: RAD52 family DNA repair protein [unclassified Cyanobium]|jgi:DNA recombination protein Rad52|uniref:RAD52 family DNA repair protein n=1 Tax=unclassified Cyanobium TaxID=2627006 RepID=UPI0020CB8ACD|nr:MULTISPECIES: RAD52 family DNA repair protein [unclassified Cyanobium]
MTYLFSPEQIAFLSAPLDRAKVRQQRQGRSSVSYLEDWQVIAEANRIFGFDGWQRQTVQTRCVHQGERLIGEQERPGWGVTYTARLRISVGEGSGAQLIREGSGAGHGIDTDLGQAHESALKEAETDAMKRALMTFGNAFGLALYDKQQREVTGGAGARPTSLRVVPPAPGPQPEPDPGLAPLDPATVRQLHAPVLAGFSKAFRKRVQVPAETVTIADRISQRRQHAGSRRSWCRSSRRNLG